MRHSTGWVPYGFNRAGRESRAEVFLRIYNMVCYIEYQRPEEARSCSLRRQPQVGYAEEFSATEGQRTRSGKPSFVPPAAPMNLCRHRKPGQHGTRLGCSCRPAGVGSSIPDGHGEIFEDATAVLEPADADFAAAQPVRMIGEEMVRQRLDRYVLCG